MISRSHAFLVPTRQRRETFPPVKKVHDASLMHPTWLIVGKGLPTYQTKFEYLTGLDFKIIF
jgi:hypothetical protein